MDIQRIDPGLQLETKLVLLRPLAAEDATALFQLAAEDENMWEYFSLNLSRKSDFERWMETAFADRTADTRRPFTIVEKSSGHLAGSMSMGNISIYDRRLEIGWSWLGRSFRGTDINRHSKYAMMKYSFDALGFERVEFKTDVLNARARKGLRKIGGVEEGILRSHMTMWNNRRRDSVYFSVLKNEWQELKQTIFKDIEDETDQRDPG